MRATTVWIGAGLLAAGAVVVGLQYRVTAKEARGLEIRIARTGREVEQARAADRHRDRLAAELESVTGEIARLERAMPSELGADEVPARVSFAAAEVGVEVEIGQLSTREREFYSEARLPVTITGGGDGIGAVIDRLHGTDRLVLVEPGGEAEGRFEVVVFAQRGLHRPRRTKSLAEVGESRVWLWGFRGRISRLADDLGRLEREREALRDAVEQVERYERERAHQVVLTELVRALVAAGAACGDEAVMAAARAERKSVAGFGHSEE